MRTRHKGIPLASAMQTAKTSPISDQFGGRSNPDAPVQTGLSNVYLLESTTYFPKPSLEKEKRNTREIYKGENLNQWLPREKNRKTSHAGTRRLATGACCKVMLFTSVYPREPEPMKELRELTAKHPWNIMITADERQFLNMFLKLINVKNPMEIGVYTAYSPLATALALPDDGKILTLDISRDNREWRMPVIQKAGVAHMIDFRECPALPVLDHLIEDGKLNGTNDFLFVDADKANYMNYHKMLI